MSNKVKLIILHQGNSPEIIESLIIEASGLNINCISFDISEKDDIDLADNFYLFYSVLNSNESKSYISRLAKKTYLIHYTFGRSVTLSKSQLLKNYDVPYVSIQYNDNTQLLKRINEMGGFPILFSSDNFQIHEENTTWKMNIFFTSDRYNQKQRGI